MKKFVSLLLAASLVFAFGTVAFADGITISAKSAILIERSTGRVLFEYEADTTMPPASITKIMTLLLVMEAIESGKLDFDTEVTASEHACSMGGSQIWLEPGEVFTVHELLKAAAIASANDACVALAEAVSGTEEAFVEAMNKRAEELGMTNTVFKNCSGLDAEGHVSTARDIAVMSAKLLSHEKIKEYSTVWMDSLRNGETELTNTNKLVRFYKGCTGLKTGSTDEAGCCLAASAERGGMELISVTLGSPNTDERFAAGRKLLDYGFANFAVAKPIPPAEQLFDIPVNHGTADSIEPVFGKAKVFLLPKGQENSIEQTVILPESIDAPIRKGDVIGKVKVSLNGGEIGEYDILAGETAEKMSFSAALKILFEEALSLG
ncbi:MAG: D-alanyl-D-alanine carboxypeptidase [Oscillospiraceae bacterium]|nr:D-alanyl-D-alanine carboxypeptidase [Oscillospiraceae bacterium]